MTQPIRDSVPYSIKLNAKDVSSGKLISNEVFYKTSTSGGVYGANTAGDTATALGVYVANWTSNLVALLNSNYTMISGVMRAIMGHQWTTPVLAVNGVAVVGTTIEITTASPHGLSEHNSILISGSASPVGFNGYHTDVHVINPTTFSFDAGTVVGPFPGPNTFQKVAGTHEFIYADQETLLDSTTGGNTTSEMMPLVCTLSVRRLNPGVGRNWRSRLSISCLNEIDNINGRLAATALANYTTACSGLDNSINAGGGVTLAAIVVSKQIAFQQVSLFTESSTWTRFATDYVPQKNIGSFTRRKPKLTATIT